MKSFVAVVNTPAVSSGNSVSVHSVATRPFMPNPLRLAAANHVLTTDDAGGFHRWLRQTGRVERDPEMVAADGSLFLIDFLDQSGKFLKPVDAGDTIYPALELTEFRAWPQHWRRRLA